MGHSSNNSETAVFRPEELFSALHHSGKAQVTSHLTPTLSRQKTVLFNVNAPNYILNTVDVFLFHFLREM